MRSSEAPPLGKEPPGFSRGEGVSNGARWVKPKAIAKRPVEYGYCYVVAREHAQRIGGEVLFGWVEEEGYRSPWSALLTHHAIVRAPDGALLDPTANGKAQPFLRDRQRPYDYEQELGWNSVLVSQVPFQIRGHDPVLPARTVLAAALMNGEIVALSNARHHLRWRRLRPVNGAMQPIVQGEQAYRATVAMGSAEPDLIDILFATNMELASDKWEPLELRPLERARARVAP